MSSKRTTPPGGHAIITGGSSGIGLALAHSLARRGYSVSILARNLDRLAAAKKAIEQSCRNGACVRTYSVDVGNAEACLEGVARSVDAFGPPAWAIACAGIVRPGRFLEQPLETHTEQIRTNYHGSLHFAHAVAPIMVEAEGGKLVFIATGAAFVGIYGYGSYAPSKFALRGLAETLRVELRRAQVAVTLVYPADTNTPQLWAEAPLRPKVTQAIASGAGVWQPEAVAERIIRCAERGAFTVTFGWRLQILSRLHSLIAPAFQLYQDHMVKLYERP